MTTAIISTGESIIDKVLGILQPRLQESLNQRYDTQLAETINKIETVSNLSDPDRANGLHDVYVKLCLDFGIAPPAGGMGDGQFIGVRVDTIKTLLTLAANAVCDKQKLADAIAKLEK